MIGLTVCDYDCISVEALILYVQVTCHTRIFFTPVRNGFCHSVSKRVDSLALVRPHIDNRGFDNNKIKGQVSDARRYGLVGRSAVCLLAIFIMSL
ncbi:hypothetical protein Plhal304r1_c002g0006051 [Plasmopara halstedii]